jgi:hypothetical protein
MACEPDATVSWCREEAVLGRILRSRAAIFRQGGTSMNWRSGDAPEWLCKQSWANSSPDPLRGDSPIKHGLKGAVGGPNPPSRRFPCSTANNRESSSERPSGRDLAEGFRHDISEIAWNSLNIGTGNSLRVSGNP